MGFLTCVSPYIASAAGVMCRRPNYIPQYSHPNTSSAHRTAVAGRCQTGARSHAGNRIPTGHAEQRRSTDPLTATRSNATIRAVWRQRGARRRAPPSSHIYRRPGVRISAIFPGQVPATRRTLVCNRGCDAITDERRSCRCAAPGRGPRSLLAAPATWPSRVSPLTSYAIHARVFQRRTRSVTTQRRVVLV